MSKLQSRKEIMRNSLNAIEINIGKNDNKKREKSRNRVKISRARAGVISFF